MPVFQRLLRQPHSLLPLIGRINFKPESPHPARRLPKQLRRGLVQFRGGKAAGGKNLAKIIVDGAIIIDDEDAAVSLVSRLIHGSPHSDPVSECGKGAPASQSAHSSTPPHNS